MTQEQKVVGTPFSVPTTGPGTSSTKIFSLFSGLEFYLEMTSCREFRPSSGLRTQRVRNQTLFSTRILNKEVVVYGSEKWERK